MVDAVGESFLVMMPHKVKAVFGQYDPRSADRVMERYAHIRA